MTDCEKKKILNEIVQYYINKKYLIEKSKKHATNFRTIS